MEGRTAVLARLIPTEGHGRSYVGLIAALTFVSLIAGQLGVAGIMGLRETIACLVSIAGLAAAGAWVSGRRACQGLSAAERRVWKPFTTGLLMWTLGNPIYLAWLCTGGDVLAPPLWSQLGFLAAYPFWYRALWLLRQPGVTLDRRVRAESLVLESSALITIVVLVGALIWRAELPVTSNLAYMLPIALDVTLGVALYNAARRTILSRRTAYLWFAVGFLALAVADASVSWLTANGNQALAAPALSLYTITLALLGWATTQSLQVSDARTDLTRSPYVLAMAALVMMGPAASTTPLTWRFGWWVLAGFIVWRLAARFRRGDNDTDPLTGMLEGRDFERYLAGLAAGANEDQPAMVLAVDLNDFAAWNQDNGFAAGDALLAEVATALGRVRTPSAGAWGRLGADRFVWAGVGPGFGPARALAEQAAILASDNPGRVDARAGFALLPRDATDPADAMAAVSEALEAARAMGRQVVAFDRGVLDGFEATSGYTASLRQRRARIQAVLADPTTIESVVQPIVDLASGRVVGHEALSRFGGEPRRSPDHWIAEAAAVGLGVEMEAACLNRALERVPGLPEGTYLSVNASAELIGSPLFEAALSKGCLGWLVIELTEHEQVNDYGALKARLSPYRARGARIAIDDAGAGHSSMRHIIELEPDLVKLDRSLIRDLHTSEPQQAMIASLVGFTARTGSKLVAEGAETDHELAVLRSIGVALGQGYGIGRPGADYLADAAVPTVLREGPEVLPTAA